MPQHQAGAEAFQASGDDRNPDFHGAPSRLRIETSIIQFEIGGAGGFEAGIGQGFVPDRIDRFGKIRDMATMGEDRVGLRGYLDVIHAGCFLQRL